MMKRLLCIVIALALSSFWLSCNKPKEESSEKTVFEKPLRLTLAQANNLGELPLACMQTEYPNKLGQTLTNKADLGEPHKLHPAFYGCFDWHSAVHGHWSLVKLLKEFPQLNQADLIVQRYIDFLPKLKYPIRVGEHSNTAFGLAFAWDYANTTRQAELKSVIESRARDFYLNDADCPLGWEPSGYDFLSPCFEEIDLMRRILNKEEFLGWMNHFAPQLKAENFKIGVGEVSDRADGKLVHLDGLNFSRAWVLYRWKIMDSHSLNREQVVAKKWI